MLMFRGAILLTLDWQAVGHHYNPELVAHMQGVHSWECLDKKNPLLQKLRVATLNVGSMRSRDSEVVETLTRRKIDLCFIQETRWHWKSARMISG